MAMSSIFAVGPRELPDSGTVLVWIDTGSGSGQEIPVPVEILQVAELDDGQGASATYTITVHSGRGSAVGEHVEERPSWDCRACGKPWPCDPAREELVTVLPLAALRAGMWMRLEVAAGDMPTSLAVELFERFLRWTG